MKIIVDAARRLLTYGSIETPCLIGGAGTIASNDKREGDRATPLGEWPLRTVVLRPDRLPSQPSLSLPWRWLRPDDGWSDDPRDPAYNCPVVHPHRFSAERFWREDGVYDVIVTLGYNDDPPRPGAGSAIFLHCTGPDNMFTEGCVAIAKGDLLTLLPRMQPGDTLAIG